MGGIYKRRFWDQWMTRPTSDAPEEFGVQHAKRLVTAVVPDFDQVPRADLQFGQVQHIECRLKPNPDGFAPDGDLTICHGLKKTTCELWRVCGDQGRRNFSCSEFVSEEGHAPMQWYKPDDAGGPDEVHFFTPR